jgi:mannose-1-phosphate guanylyltransferase
MSEVDHFWAVVPAGGAGTRLWPLSRSGSPKYLLDLTGSGRSLIQQTAGRLTPLVGDRLLVVTGAAHRDAIGSQLPDLDADAILVEPSPRDSMAAIGLAAALVERRDPDAVIGSFAADHVIADAGHFHEAVRRAVAAAADGWLVTIGITPTSPATGFGYVEVGDRLETHGGGVHRAVEFVEKPDEKRAQEYVAGGRHRWNAGMFVARPGVLLDLLADQDPAFAGRLRSIAAEPTRLTELWDELPRIAIDHAVAEPAAAAGRVAVVPADLAWDDLGDVDSLARVLGAEGTLRVLGTESLVTAVGATGLVVPRSGRVVAVVGLDDVVVVDTPDALLVTSREHAQRVKEIVAGLEKAGHNELR